MYLRSLKLRGFKSFPDSVEIRLEPGVAIVVGPNGSGKSNVADAIRWAAGSQSPHDLRAEKADDVLYAGSGERAPAEHCEVELVFDNTDGGGAVAYTEISVMRRLHRGGEGQYLVNRTPVRRLDLVELLADLGVGGEMHSIISQGRVEEILASRPAERRALVEEAAGLGNFKRRRHRAELKLARVRVQVERARDLEDEVRKRLRPLALQATAAERAEKLGAEIETLRAEIAWLDLRALESRLADAMERREAAERLRAGAREKLESILAERNRAEEELADAAGRREEATAELYRVRSAADRLALRREGVQALLERLRTDLAAAEEAAATGGPELERLRLEALAARDAAREAALGHAGALGELRPVLAALASSAEAAVSETLTERSLLDERIAAATGAREAATAALYRLGSAADRVALRREAAQALVAGLDEDVRVAEAAARRGSTPAELEVAANEAAAVARAAALRRDELADRARSTRDRLAALEQSLAERSGIAPAARALAEAGERLALSLLEVEPGLERAVAAALAWKASAIVASDAAAALALLERARIEGLGGLGVVLERPETDPGARPVAGAELLSGAISGPDSARRLLADFWLVEREQLPEVRHGRAVTREGHGFDADRGELWLAGETPEAVLIELEGRRRALAAEAAELERQARTSEGEAGGAARQAEAAEAAFAEVAHLRELPLLDVGAARRLRAAGARLDSALASAAGAAARLEEAARASIGAGAHEAREAEAERGRARQAEDDARREAADAAARLSAADLELARLERPLPPADAARDDADELRELAAVLTERAEQAAAAAGRAAERARAAATAYESAAPARVETGDPALIGSLVSCAARLDETLARASAAAVRFEPPLKGRVDAGSLRTGELAAELRRLGSQEAELRRALTEASEHAAGIEVELARLEAEAEEVRRRIRGDVDVDEGVDREELALRLDRLVRRREQLGQVNPLAKEDYEREKERLAELAEQREDLEASLDELEQLRAELTETVEKRFTETYAAVERHFVEVATTLFPGGTGRLRLAEEEADEDVEPGIEVELQPAGKRITRLSLLSGGEKALGAIAFLFALFLARPCPFYLLDEVEAALDDTNIGRFVELLRSFADRAQFIVVTHQKRTMEAADILYGVTMGPDGVTQVVSKRLAAEQAHSRIA